MTKAAIHRWSWRSHVSSFTKTFEEPSTFLEIPNPSIILVNTTVTMQLPGNAGLFLLSSPLNEPRISEIASHFRQRHPSLWAFVDRHQHPVAGNKPRLKEIDEQDVHDGWCSEESHSETLALRLFPPFIVIMGKIHRRMMPHCAFHTQITNKLTNIWASSM